MKNTHEVFCQFSNVQIALKVGSAVKLTDNVTDKSGLYEVTDMSFNDIDNTWLYEFTHRQKHNIFDKSICTLKRSQCKLYHALPISKNMLLDSKPLVKRPSDMPTDDEDDTEN